MRESSQTERVRDARGGLLLTHPFFGVLSLKLELRETSETKTICVSTDALQFNPAFIDSLSNAELKAVIAHEVMHLGLLHHARQGARDSALWNTACDYAINPNLVIDGFTLPKGALLDQRFDGMPAESIYQILRDENQPPPPPPPKGGKPQAGDGGQEPQSGAGQSDGQGEPQAGKGDGATGSFEPAGPDGSAEAGEAESDWQANANEAMRAAQSAGKMPAGLRRVVEQALLPQADWKALLRRFMTDQVKTRATWSKKNKRFPDIHLPGRTREGMGPLVVGVDTSGSITQAVLDRFAAEITAIAADVEPAAIHIVYCDAQVNHVESFEQGETIKLSACGGGGTRFSPVFARVEDEGWNPAALVYLTDLCCNDWPGEQAFPVLWASYGAEGATAPMGETIAID